MKNTVTIDCFPESVIRYRHGYAVVAVDVVRATTSAITAVATGRRCFPVPNVKAALELAREIPRALLAGEQSGITPAGFDLNNSPAELARRNDIARPLILLSSSGTLLCYEASFCEAAFVASLRNYAATARHLALRFPAICLIGAGSHNEFREEDQMCCAWLAECLMDLGYTASDRKTLDYVTRWSGKPADAWIANKSAAYLKESNQCDDLEFILNHVGDLSMAFALRDGEVVTGAPSLRTRVRSDWEESI